MNEADKNGTIHEDVRGSYDVVSPSNQLRLTVGIDGATLWYEVYRSEAQLIRRSHLSVFDARHRNLAAIEGEYQVETVSHDETWEQPWGEQRLVRDNHTEFSIRSRGVTVRFRVFDDSFGFRYELAGDGEVEIAKEESAFNISQESRAWWIPALGQNHYEHLYKKTPINEIDTAHTPLTLELEGGVYAAIHEAALYNYGSMNIVSTEDGLMSAVTPLINGTAAKVVLPFKTPWRTVIFSDTAHGLGNSKIMLNLNEPSRITDPSWIRPTKFMGIWWGMFIGKYTWASGDRHGATTANAFRYINAAKKLGIPALLIEGWNETWDGEWMNNGDAMNHLKPYEDFDIHAVTAYAKSQGIDIIGHHETSGSFTHYESELPEAYDYYKLFGVNYVKTGYVHPRLDTGDFHSSQTGVRHYQNTVELLAERQMMVDIHEPVKGTGIERTWPNLMTREGVMGQEYEGGAVTPEHTAVLPFTRLLAGPLDYTPGLFNLNGKSRKVSSTLAKQLAFYVTMYSPMQMAADLPEHYFDQPAFQFIKDVPVNWERTVPLDGVIGDYYVVARKDRTSEDWFIGGVSDEESRSVTFKLDFIPEHRTFEATVYRDADDAHWQTNPEACLIETARVSHGDTLTLKMAAGGGFAMRLKPEGETVSPYPDA